MRTAAHDRSCWLLSSFLLAGLVPSASTLTAGVNVWTTNGPSGEQIRALAIDPTNPATLYAGTLGGGVFKSTDGGGSWAAINNGLTSTSVNALAIDPSPVVRYAGMSWGSVILYAGTSSGGRGSVFKSTDGGENWTAVNTGLYSTSVNALAIDPSNPATLYAGNDGNGIYKSTDSGGTWAAINAGLTPFLIYVGSLAVDPVAPATLYAGLAGPVVFKSTNSGDTWSGILGEPWDSGGYPALAIDPAAPSTVYATTDSGLFKSDDGGSSWTAVNSGLPDAYVAALAIDPSEPATLYAGTWGGGVFKSVNGGASWTSMNAGLTNLNVRALVIDPSNPSRLYAGTDAGVYEFLTVAGPCVGNTTTLCLNGGHFKVTTQWSTRDGVSGAGQAIPITDLAGYFTLFDSSNVEIEAKVRKECGVHSRWWTFAAGLTDVSVILTVTDTQTNAVKTYTPNAFAPCP